MAPKFKSLIKKLKSICAKKTITPITTKANEPHIDPGEGTSSGLKKKNDNDIDYDDDDYPEFPKPKRKPHLALRILKWTTIVLFILIILLFLCTFVIFPIIFMESLSIQRFLIFPNFDQPSNPEYNNFTKYGARGVHNFYVTVTDLQNSSNKISLGVWQIVPTDRIGASEIKGFSFEDELRNSEKPIAIYFHGQSGTRIYPYILNTYNVMREFFHILAFDYRSYGDSSVGLLTEENVVHDSVQFYEWVVKNTNQEEIYVWGHSLGTALSTHTVKKLKNKNNLRYPKGLVLEAPFTTMRDEVSHHPIGKVFAWLPWFSATILDPLEKNGFLFRTTTNILSVDCYVMVLHAEDDSVIPWHLGEEVYKTAKYKRDPKTQKNATFHLIPAIAKSNHMEITRYKEVPQYIRDFLKETRKS